MNPVAILQILAGLPQLIQAGADIFTAATHAAELLQRIQSEGREPTEQEWADLNARIQSLRAELHHP